MKCYCNFDLKIKKIQNSYDYTCIYKECKYFGKTLIYIDNSGFFYIGETKEGYSYGFCYNIKNIYINGKDIIIDYDMMQELLKFHSMNQVKECYENYALFI